MKRILAGLLTAVFLETPVMAEDWTGQPLTTPVQGGIGGPTGAQGGNSYMDYYGGYATYTTARCAPREVAPPCLPGEAVKYLEGGYLATFTNTVPPLAAGNSNVGVSLDGYYADPASPSGISYFSGKVPLSAFATSSSLQALQGQLLSLSAQTGSTLQTVQAQIAGINAQMSQVMQSIRINETRADQGTSMALAMAGVPDLQPDEHFAVSMNFGTFRGQTGQAFGAAYRMADHFSVNGGIVASLNGGGIGGRAGMRLGW